MQIIILLQHPCRSLRGRIDPYAKNSQFRKRSYGYRNSLTASPIFSTLSLLQSFIRLNDAPRTLLQLRFPRRRFRSRDVCLYSICTTTMTRLTFAGISRGRHARENSCASIKPASPLEGKSHLDFDRTGSLMLSRYRAEQPQMRFLSHREGSSYTGWFLTCSRLGGR